MTTAIFWPTFALVALVYAVLLMLGVKRFGYIRSNPPRRADFASSAAMKSYFTPVSGPADNLSNLFEMPVLYFALVPLLLLFHHANHIQVALAWLFVALRVAHSIVHIGGARANVRFIIYFAGCIVLSVMWIGFAIDMAGATSAAAANAL
ncbi:MAPEG family protein [Sphingomonas crusticola]|uniref:MAPEG family protein n=1 Tax=Sphingomonas crusticola TaxID=1697973 RepID=UPI000E24564C|nr:MAPEG family protein [Sphingomonas crusticola]